MVDLDRPELAHDFFSRGPGALMRQPDRDTLAAMYRTAEADALARAKRFPGAPAGGAADGDGHVPEPGSLEP